MAANITTNSKTGKAEMFYTGQTPWHGLGTKLDLPQTAEQAIKEAGLDWEVVSYPVSTFNSNGTVQIISGKQAIVRADNNEVFNVFSRSYTPLQNRDAFGFFDKVVGEGQAIYHTAGSLAGGKRIWILAQLPGTLQVTKKDVLEKYVLLANSHDGSLAVHMRMTPIRVVCQNTLMAALDLKGEQAGHFRSEHQGNIGQRVVEARDLLGLSEAYFARLMEGVEALVKTPMNNNDLNHFLWEVYQLDPELPLSDQFHLKQLSYNETLRLFEEGVGIADDKEVRGTAWAAYNAVTEFVDHFKPVGQSQDSLGSKEAKVMDKRLDSAWFGAGAKIKAKAWKELVSINN